MESEDFDGLVHQLAAADPETRRAARDRLLSSVIEHMRAVAHRMMRGFPQVRRWDETDDIVQGAALRLARALDSVALVDSRHLLGLIATQVRRELVDLARRYGGAGSFAYHHGTNAAGNGGQEMLHTDAAVDPAETGPGGVASWTRFHEAAAALGDDDRELFNLVWYLGLTQDQAASAMGCSVRTIARRWDVLKRHLVFQLGGQAPT
jgi:DNA-directed RNA polymerase specialized sigma24 family protein